MKIRTWLLAATAAVGLTAAAAPMAQARDMRIALGDTDVYPAYQPLVRFAETIGAEADLPSKVYALSLLNYAETAGGLRDGLADIGFVVFPYFPSEFSEINLIANLAMLATTGDDVPTMPGAAMAGAIMEYALLNCDDCMTQMSANNQVYLSGAATTRYVLLCNKPVSTAEEAKGKRFRAGAANWARWADAVGGAAVTVPGNETYDALGQGIVDCTMSTLADLVGGRFIDVTSHVTTGQPGGVFSGLGAANINKDVWQGLTNEQRATLLKAASRLSAEIVFAYLAVDMDGLAAAKEKGVTIYEGDASLAAISEKFVQDDVATISRQFTEQFRLQNVDAKIETFGGILSKWKGLTKDIGEGDVDQLSALYWDEIVSKVDPATHGMN